MGHHVGSSTSPAVHPSSAARRARPRAEGACPRNPPASKGVRPDAIRQAGCPAPPEPGLGRDDHHPEGGRDSGREALRSLEELRWCSIAARARSGHAARWPRGHRRGLRGVPLRARGLFTRGATRGAFRRTRGGTMANPGRPRSDTDRRRHGRCRDREVRARRDGLQQSTGQAVPFLAPNPYLGHCDGPGNAPCGLPAGSGPYGPLRLPLCIGTEGAGPDRRVAPCRSCPSPIRFGLRRCPHGER